MSNTVMHKWVTPTEEHLRILSETLRKEDAEEVLAYDYESTFQTLEQSVKQSTDPKVWLVDGVPALICGVAITRLLGTATPWALSSPLVDAHPYIMLHGSRIIVDGWRKEHTYMKNYVDARYIKSIKWLHWLGFEIGDAIPFGPKQLPFHPIEMRTDGSNS